MSNVNITTSYKKLLQHASHWTLKHDSQLRALLQEETGRLLNSINRLETTEKSLSEDVESLFLRLESVHNRIECIKNERLVEEKIEELRIIPPPPKITEQRLQDSSDHEARTTKAITNALMLGFDLIDSEQLCVDHNRPSQNERPLRIHPRKTNYRSLPPIIGSNEFFKLIQESETKSKPTVSSINSSHKDDFLDEHLEGLQKIEFDEPSTSSSRFVPQDPTTTTYARSLENVSYTERQTKQDTFNTNNDTDAGISIGIEVSDSASIVSTDTDTRARSLIKEHIEPKWQQQTIQTPTRSEADDKSISKLESISGNSKVETKYDDRTINKPIINKPTMDIQLIKERARGPARRLPGAKTPSKNVNPPLFMGTNKTDDKLLKSIGTQEEADEIMPMPIKESSSAFSSLVEKLPVKPENAPPTISNSKVQAKYDNQSSNKPAIHSAEQRQIQEKDTSKASNSVAANKFKPPRKSIFDSSSSDEDFNPFSNVITAKREPNANSMSFRSTLPTTSLSTKSNAPVPTLASRDDQSRPIKKKGIFDDSDSDF